MELLILGTLAFIAVLAVVPDAVVKLGLVAAWGLGALAVIVSLVRCVSG